MKTRLLIIIGIVLVPLIIPNVSAICAAESLEWWEACNDEGPENALPLNPVLIIILFVMGIIAVVVIVFFIWRKRK